MMASSLSTNSPEIKIKRENQLNARRNIYVVSRPGKEQGEDREPPQDPGSQAADGGIGGGVGPPRLEQEQG